MRVRQGITTVVLIVTTAIALPSAAHAETFNVELSPAVSAGKVITGSGQNLPSLRSPTPWNIGSHSARQVSEYYTSGAAAADQSSVTKAALRWTQRWVEQECGSKAPKRVRVCKAAAVFDFDDTLVSSFPVLASNPGPFEFDRVIDAASIRECRTPAIPATRALFNSLKRMGVTPFVVTGRGEDERIAIESCLATLGFTDYGALLLKAGDTHQLASRQKANHRKSLIEQGWKIGPSIGDQVSDMSYGYLTRGFLLPNVMYFIP
jgi:hypothetical protein